MRRILRNAAFLFAGQGLTWLISIVMLAIVPRALGPGSWGDLSIAVGIGAIITSAANLGIPSLVVREVARDHGRASAWVSTAMTLQALLAPPLLIAAAAFALVAGYPPHTRLLVLVYSTGALLTLIAAPAAAALQAYERMHLNAVIAVATQALWTAVAAALVLSGHREVILLVVVIQAGGLLGAGLQTFLVNRTAALRPRLDLGLMRRLVRGGSAFWVSTLLLSVYMWIDSIMLSVLASTREVGYYTPAIRIVASLGFLPFVVTSVVFPALSRGSVLDRERMARLGRLCIQVVIGLSLPICVGAWIVGPNLVQLMLGPSFAPTAVVIRLLMPTLPAIYLATLVYWFLAAVDRQRRWAIVMAAVCVINPILNLVAIRVAETVYGHGSWGAAAALLVTDGAMGFAALALMPREILHPLQPLLRPLLRSALATAVMAVPVWLLRDRVIVLPVAAGALVFAVAAVAAGAIRPADVRAALAILRRRSEPSRDFVDVAEVSAL